MPRKGPWWKLLRRVGAGLLPLVLLSGLWGMALAATEGPDPKPYIDPGMTMSIPPGPGWPAGWQEPPVPTEIPKVAVDTYNDELAMPTYDKPERLAMWVIDPMPAWTKEYPYYWQWQPAQCGTTFWVVWYPEPNISRLYEMTGGDRYSYGRKAMGGTPGTCRVVPVTYINVHKRDLEAEEQGRLDNQMLIDLFSSQGGKPVEGHLDECAVRNLNGTPENIPVCFNGGNASKQFDAPAYLDVAVGRVRIPVRFVSELMGAVVTWDPDARSVTLDFPAVKKEIVRPVSRPGFQPSDWWEPVLSTPNSKAYKYVVQTVTQPERHMVLTVGKPVALVDGLEVGIDAPPVIQPPGRVMVPVRFIAEALGAKVYWVGAEPVWYRDETSFAGRNQVHIYTVLHPFYEYPNWVLEHKAQRF